MHFSSTTLVALSAFASLATTSPIIARGTTTTTTACPLVKEGDYIWKLSNLYLRKPNGTAINSVGFNIKATNNGTLDFNCSATTAEIVPAKFYDCGGNSGIYFAYQDDRSGLLLRQDVSKKIQWIGTATLPNICRAGGAGTNDLVCDGVDDAYITLIQSPDKLK